MRHSRHGNRHDKDKGEGRARPGRRGYHHGNLKEALVMAARQLILEKGPHGFSLIEAARLADVSPAAPYRHFKDKDALLAEVARLGFESLSTALNEAWDGGMPEPAAALQRIGEAYLEFARTERASYAAMFEAGLNADQGSELQAAAARAYTTMAHVAEAFAGSDANPASVSPRQIFFHIWSLAHGAATLSAGDASGGSIGQEEAFEMLGSGVDTYLRGLRNS